MYGKCGEIGDVYQVFDRIPHRDQVSWNSMISSLCKFEEWESTLEAFRVMQLQNADPSSFTLVSVALACSYLNKHDGLRLGKQIHGYSLRTWDEKTFTNNALITMYAKLGRVDYSKSLFEQFENRDMVSWNTVISSLTQNDRFEEALVLLRLMVSEGVKPDVVTFASVLPACSHLEKLEIGKEIHAYTLRNDDIIANSFVGSALVDMYCNCGQVKSGRRVFDGITERRIGLWNAMIAGYAQKGAVMAVVSPNPIWRSKRTNEMISGSSSVVVKEEGFFDEEDNIKAGDSEIMFVRMQPKKPMDEHIQIFDKLPSISVGESLQDLVIIGCGPDTIVYLDTDEPIRNGCAYGRVSRQLIYEELLKRSELQLTQSFHKLKFFTVTETCNWQHGEQKTLAFGAAASMVHPAHILSEAPRSASVIAEILKNNSDSKYMVDQKKRGTFLWPKERKHQRAFSFCGLELIVQLDIGGKRTFFQTFFGLPDWLIENKEVDSSYIYCWMWKGFLGSSLSLTDLLLFAIYMFVIAPNSMRKLLVRHLLSDPTGALMVKTYLA
ncbi:hypothetical protein MKX01_018829 [Papaver californicum]|nr:hypothetical protein MKX01_018829 [Papaver californicum]